MRKMSFPLEIFATDISETAIEKARAGIYGDAALANVSPERLTRFFTRSERGYQIAKSIRDVCVFARHNVAQDPPFSRLDLISFCNVLIYLGAELQRKVLSILHYSLKPTGFLVLGPSESIGTLSQSFHQLEKTHRIYCLLPPSDQPALPLNHGRRPEARVELRQRISEGQADVLKEADRLVLAEHGPPGAIIDEEMNIVQIRGRIAPYLELSPGEPTRNLLKLAREGLIAGMGKAIRAARQTNATAKEDGFRIDGSGQLKEVAIKVTPFTGSSSPTSAISWSCSRMPSREREPEGQRQARDRRTTREAPGCGENWRRPESICNRSSRIMQARWKSFGQRTKRRRRATRNWKPRRKSWSPPTKN